MAAVVGVRTRLQQLDVWPEIRERLLWGEPAIDLARFIQAERQALLDVSTYRIAVILIQYRESEQGATPPADDDARSMRMRFYLESTRVRVSLAKAVDEVVAMTRWRLKMIQEDNARGQLSAGIYYQELEAFRRLVETALRVQKAIPKRLRDLGEDESPAALSPELVLEERRRIGVYLKLSAQKMLADLRAQELAERGRGDGAARP